MSDPTAPGVAYVPPPSMLFGPIRQAIDKAVAEIEPTKRGALVAVANEEGANAAVVAKIGSVWTVQAWVGKTWKGSTNYGATVKASW